MTVVQISTAIVWALVGVLIIFLIWRELRDRKTLVDSANELAKKHVEDAKKHAGEAVTAAERRALADVASADEKAKKEVKNAGHSLVEFLRKLGSGR